MEPFDPTVCAIRAGVAVAEAAAAGLGVEEDPDVVACPPQAASAPVMRIAAGRTRHRNETMEKTTSAVIRLPAVATRGRYADRALAPLVGDFLTNVIGAGERVTDPGGNALRVQRELRENLGL